MHRFKYPFKKEYLRGLGRYEAYTTDYHSSNTVLWSKKCFLNVRLKNTKIKVISYLKNIVTRFFAFTDKNVSI